MSVLVIAGGPEDEAGWHAAMRAALPEEEVVRRGPSLDRVAVTAAVVAAPPAGSLARLPNLRLIQSLWAGVDGLLADPGLPPGVPVARLVDPALTASMVESVLLHVLALHRRMPEYRRFQAQALWRSLPQKAAASRRIGVLGLGTLGAASARALAGLGFPVSGWARSQRQLAGVHCLSGAAGLAVLLADAEILVNLLPLTAETHGLLSASLFAQLSPGSSVINLGRGGHLVEADLLAALDRGHLAHAVLDVLGVEPAAPDHPLWHHPRVTLTPHVAAPSDPASAVRVAAEAVRRQQAGLPVANLVDLTHQY